MHYDRRTCKIRYTPPTHVPLPFVPNGEGGRSTKLSEIERLVKTGRITRARKF